MNFPAGTVQKSSDENTMVKLKNISKGFPDKRTEKMIQTIDDVSLGIQSKQFVTIIGPSGCGKTTLLNIISGLASPDEGTIIFNEFEGKNPKNSMAYVFQRDSLLPWRTLYENVTLGLEIRGFSNEEISKTAHTYIEMVGLSEFKNHLPHELSGGMRKRVELIRALAYNPILLLLDEPFGALDAQTKILLQDELLALVARQGKTVIMVTHDLEEAVALSDLVVVMTARPARIKSIHTIDLPKPRSSSNARSFPKFYDQVKDIWSELKEEIILKPLTDGAP